MERMTLADEGPNGLGIRRVSPVRQVLTIFGDYWWHVEEPMPTGALVAALADLGVKEPAARATLTRMTRNGLLTVDRAGRRTVHRLTERAQAKMPTPYGDGFKIHVFENILDGREHIALVKTGLPGVAWVRLDRDAEWPPRLTIKVPD